MPDLTPPVSSEPPARYRRKTIGRSAQGRRLRVRFVGNETAPLRIFVLSDQHGDERLASEAVRRFTRQMRVAGALAAGVQLALVRSANPDGAQARARRNAEGVDLNRDHQLLSAPETRAVHRFARQWRPHLVLDLHTYPPRRNALLARNLMHSYDVYLDGPTNPNLLALPAGQLARQLVEALLPALDAEGYRSTRYLLLTKTQRVRHSTPDVTDARTALALRLGVPAVLVEGREPRGEGRVGRERTRSALCTALRAAVAWAEHHAAELIACPLRKRNQLVILRSLYAPARHRLRATFTDAETGELRKVELPELYTPELRPTERVPLPAAYAVPRRMAALVELLARHGFAGESAPPQKRLPVEVTQIGYLLRSLRPRRVPLDLAIRRRRELLALGDYLLYRTAGNPALAVFLEANSHYALHRYVESRLALGANCCYPILRVLADEQAQAGPPVSSGP